MKKLFLMTFVACFAMMFASCEKDVELNGTTWHAHDTATQQITQMGITVDAAVDMDCTIAFADATSGTLTTTLGGTITVFGETQTVPQQTYTDGFSYTFDGKTGVLTSTDPNETETIPFTYNKKDKSIDVEINQKDEESGLDLTFHLHFVQQ